MNPTPPALPPQQPDSWERSMLEKLLMQVYQEQRRERMWRWIRRLVWVLLLLLIFAMMLGGNRDLSRLKSEHTAVINLAGVIDSYNDNAAKLIEGLENAYANPKVKGIIIRADSPGGSPVISDTAFVEIQRLKKEHADIPLYVVTEDVCASGCYYIAAVADKIYANRASMVGSIGVIGGGFGMTEIMDKLGIERRLKTAGKYKAMGDPFRPETAEENAIWQEMLDDIHGQFIEAVKQGRGERLLWQQNPDVFSGRVYTGTEAKKLGLIDDFGSIYSVSRDVIGAKDMVDYTPQDDFSKTLGRRFGAQIKQGLNTLTAPSW
ncbi:MAG: signal peptide peptidase SppA [Neisseria sp.]|nr:signal peptide peptidase SppA [Neisseria sp.]